MNHQIRINHPYPPALRRCLQLAFEDGLTSNKDQARAEGVSPRSIENRWERLADALQLRWGQRTRERVVIELVRNRHVEYLMLMICLWVSCQQLNDTMVRAPRITRRQTTQRVRNRQSRFPQPNLEDML